MKRKKLSPAAFTRTIKKVKVYKNGPCETFTCNILFDESKSEGKAEYELYRAALSSYDDAPVIRAGFGCYMADKIDNYYIYTVRIIALSLARELARDGYKAEDFFPNA